MTRRTNWRLHLHLPIQDIPHEYRQLRRQNGVIAGVCGGLGDFFGVSAFWFRLLFLILLLPGGLPGLLPYIVAWIVIPAKR